MELDYFVLCFLLQVLELAGTSSPCLLQFDENLTGVKVIDAELEKVQAVTCQPRVCVCVHACM